MLAKEGDNNALQPAYITDVGCFGTATTKNAIFLHLLEFRIVGVHKLGDKHYEEEGYDHTQDCWVEK